MEAAGGGVPASAAKVTCSRIAIQRLLDSTLTRRLRAVAGHSSIAISGRYAHPSENAVLQRTGRRFAVPLSWVMRRVQSAWRDIPCVGTGGSGHTWSGHSTSRS